MHRSLAEFEERLEWFGDAPVNAKARAFWVAAHRALRTEFTAIAGYPSAKPELVVGRLVRDDGRTVSPLHMLNAYGVTSHGLQELHDLADAMSRATSLDDAQTAIVHLDSLLRERSTLADWGCKVRPQTAATLSHRFWACTDPLGRRAWKNVRDLVKQGRIPAQRMLRAAYATIEGHEAKCTRFFYPIVDLARSARGVKFAFQVARALANAWVAAVKSNARGSDVDWCRLMDVARGKASARDDADGD